jgi:hypothetical protein
MKKMLTGALGGGALVVLLALTQDDPLQAIRAAVAELGLRIDRLEHASGKGDTASTADTAAVRSMVLVSVHIANKNPDQSEEIAELQQQCAALMNTDNASADAAAGAIGSAISNNDATYARGGVSGWGNRSAGGSERTAGGGFGVAQQAGDLETEQRYATLSAIKLQELQALKDAANTPKQILIGHNASVIFTLNSKVDLSDALNNIPIGATVTWTGTRLSADDASETWRIDSIKAVGK